MKKLHLKKNINLVIILNILNVPYDTVTLLKNEKEHSL